MGIGDGKDGRTHYDVLGLSPDCSAEEVKNAFRRVAKETHPDVSGSNDTHAEFLRVDRAFRVLGDSSLRNAYDIEIGIENLRQSSNSSSDHDQHSRGSSMPMETFVRMRTNQIERSSAFYYRQMLRRPRTESERMKRIHNRSSSVRSASSLLPRLAIPFCAATALGFGFTLIL